MITANKLPELLQWKKDLHNQAKAIRRNAELEGTSPSILKKLAIIQDQLSVCLGRIEKLGNRYNIVRVQGIAKVPLRGENTQIMVSSKYEMYFSDCSLADAMEFVRMHFGSLNIISIKPEIIQTKEARIISK